MISLEQRAEIRRLYYAEHWRAGTIASALGVHRDVVLGAIEAERFHLRGGRPRASAVDPYMPFVQGVLAQYPRLRATRLYEMLRDRGYRGSVVQLRRVVTKIRPRPKAEAYLRLRVLPGEQAQVDWGSFGKVEIGGASRALSCFVMVLSWSRAVHVLRPRKREQKIQEKYETQRTVGVREDLFRVRTHRHDSLDSKGDDGKEAKTEHEQMIGSNRALDFDYAGIRFRHLRLRPLLVRHKELGWARWLVTTEWNCLPRF